MPIKAALKEASCSMFRDPLVTKFFNVVVEGSSGQLAEEIMLNTCRRIKVNGLFFWRINVCSWQEIQLQKWIGANEERRSNIELNP